LGAVGFASYGGVASDLSSYNFSEFRWAAGAGLRIVLSKKDKVNIRVDVGWGQGNDAPNFYITVGEAF